MAKRASSSKAKSGGTLDASTRICVLHGPDEIVRRQHLDELRTALEAAHGELEVSQYDGKTAALSDVLDELRSFSLMQQYKLVLLDDAETFVTAHRSVLERYAEAPVDNATLVLRASTWRPGNLDKLIVKVGAVIKCAAMNPADAQRWLINAAEQLHHSKLKPQAASELYARLGGDLAKAAGELGKLALQVGVGEAIDVGHVEAMVGRSSEEDVWAIQEAILEAMIARGPAGQTATAAALSKLHELLDLAGHHPTLVTYFVADLVRKLNQGVMMKRSGMPDGMIAKSLKLWGPRQNLFMRAMQQVGSAELARLFDRIVALDMDGKSSRGEPVRNLESYCVSLGA